MNYLEHSYKGSVWKKHKYLHKMAGKYFYPERAERLRTSGTKPEHPIMNPKERIEHDRKVKEIVKKGVGMTINAINPTILNTSQKLVDSALNATKTLDILQKTNPNISAIPKAFDTATSYLTTKQTRNSANNLMSSGLKAIEKLLKNRGAII